MGQLTGDVGKGSFRMGVATAATQIEDMNTATDWYLWTLPTDQGGFGKGDFVGDATRGYSLVDTDLALVDALGVDSYRFSIEWARVEPVKDQIDETALAHYRTELEALHSLGIRPLVTVHHFSNPVWVADPRGISCANGPTDTNLCGFGSPGGTQIAEQLGEHAALLATRLGDLVDEWGTVNEPVNYLFAGYAVGQFPPGQFSLDPVHFAAVLRDYLAAHVAIYDAIKANDTVDADGDGAATSIGLSLSVADWEPARSNGPSEDPEDLGARDRIQYLFHYLFIDSIRNGSFDSNLDGTPDEPHPEWAGRLDWLGLQYYFRAGVTGRAPLLPAPISVTPCFGGLDFGACLPAPDPSYCVPHMGYEGYTDGIGDILIAYAARYPDLPLVVSEAGIATETPKRRAENIVRVLESIERARQSGVDVRGYYHWSLTDNFEWVEGFAPHFGLYTTHYSDYSRTGNEGTEVFTQIASSRQVTHEQRTAYGGTGPMTPEADVQLENFCRKQ
ncbi:MAG: Beta-glucosidase/6-phospho-beta-glucosidase/beta-galactosidase [Deltaproteobacteria bacterium]|nr:Beta-glucosidase/6-phospho-beta-glucosidase/beta-galactosidase [Deltaproteobacteria bacterium]